LATSPDKNCDFGPNAVLDNLEHQQNNKMLMAFLVLFIAFLLIGKAKSTKSIKRIKVFSSARLLFKLK
jgi:hypothetical protein